MELRQRGVGEMGDAESMEEEAEEAVEFFEDASGVDVNIQCCDEDCIPSRRSVIAGVATFACVTFFVIVLLLILAASR